jgi:hypothetical protein
MTFSGYLPGHSIGAAPRGAGVLASMIESCKQNTGAAVPAVGLLLVLRTGHQTAVTASGVDR